MHDYFKMFMEKQNSKITYFGLIKLEVHAYNEGLFKKFMENTYDKKTLCGCLNCFVPKET